MGGRQLGLTDYEQSTAKKRTRREKFLAEMEKVVPWQGLVELIEPHYPKTGEKGGRPPYPLPTMLRIHLMQQWYSLSDPAMEETLIEVPSMRRFAGIDLMSDRIPDETTILTRSMPDRIVNLVQRHVRPIVRGKARAAVEFGAKISVSVCNGFAFLYRISWDPYNKAEDLIPQAKKYKQEHRCYPERICADRIYINTKNRNFCTRNNIRLSGKRLGRPPKDPEIHAAHKQQLSADQ
jgi:hypothetical protein